MFCWSLPFVEGDGVGVGVDLVLHHDRRVAQADDLYSRERD
jgi:hypothetical protein